MIRIANAGGYWGDDPFALRRQVHGALALNYITIDYLAELTMSILQKQKAKDPTLGYAKDFIVAIEPLLEECLEKNITIVTNAGGLNPKSCKDALINIAQKKNISLKIAVVDGDDILHKIDELHKKNISFDNTETGESFTKCRDRVSCANVYFGAQPMADALKHNPNIVICGRVTDSSLTLGPLIHEFNWHASDYDKLAHGIVAGHLLECGAQACGGNFTDWKKVPSFIDIGFPIVECFADGSFVLTKHPNTGGIVTEQTVCEQLLYETFDPKNYLTPDVIADFTTIQLTDDGYDRVKITQVQGKKPTDLFKVSLAYKDGYKCTGTIILSGPDAYQKAKIFEKILWSRLDSELKLMGFKDSIETKKTEFIGDDSTHKGMLKDHGSYEILLRFGAYDHNQDKLAVFRKLLPSLILSGPSGVAVTGGAPAISEIVSFWPTLIPKWCATPNVQIFESNHR